MSRFLRSIPRMADRGSGGLVVDSLRASTGSDTPYPFVSLNVQEETMRITVDSVECSAY